MIEFLNKRNKKKNKSDKIKIELTFLGSYFAREGCRPRELSCVSEGIGANARWLRRTAELSLRAYGVEKKDGGLKAEVTFL